MTAVTPTKILGMIDAGLTNVKIAGEVGKQLAVKGDLEEKVVVKEPEAKWLKKAQSMRARIEAVLANYGWTSNLQNTHEQGEGDWAP